MVLSPTAFPASAPPPVHDAGAASPSPARPAAGQRVLGAAAATAALGSAVAHLAASMTHGSVLTTAVMLAMTLGCLPCAVHLLRRPGYRAWATSTFLSAAMLAAHTLLMAPTAGGGHHPAALGTAVVHTGHPELLTALLILPALGLALGITGLATSPDRPRPSLEPRP